MLKLPEPRDCHLSSQIEGTKLEPAEWDVHADVHYEKPTDFWNTITGGNHDWRLAFAFIYSMSC